MKFKIFCLSLIMVFFSIPVVCFSEPNSSTYELLGEHYGGKFYYNKKNLAKTSGIVSVWTYQAVTEDFRKERIEVVKKRDVQKSAEYENLDHASILNEIDCKKKLIRRKEILEYDHKGKVLSRYVSKNLNWEDIPDSCMNEILYQKVCATPKKSTKGKH
jgi:hypothetical protein